MNRFPGYQFKEKHYDDWDTVTELDDSTLEGLITDRTIRKKYKKLLKRMEKLL